MDDNMYPPRKKMKREDITEINSVINRDKLSSMDGVQFSEKTNIVPDLPSKLSDSFPISASLHESGGESYSAKRNSQNADKGCIMPISNECLRFHQQTEGMIPFPEDEPFIYYNNLYTTPSSEGFHDINGARKTTYTSVFEIITRPNEKKDLSNYIPELKEFYKTVFQPLLDKAGIDDYVSLSIKHESFQAGNSKSDLKRHHEAAFFVNKNQKSLIDWEYFAESVQKIEQSNSNFSLDGEMIIKLLVTKPKYVGGHPILDEQMSTVSPDITEHGKYPAIEHEPDDYQSFSNNNNIISEDYFDDDLSYTNDSDLRSYLAKHYSTRQGYYQIRNSGDDCGWLAFALGKYLADNPNCRNQKNAREHSVFRNFLCGQRDYIDLKKYLKTLTVELPQFIIENRLREADLSQLQKVFKEYKIIVYHRPLRKEDVRLRILFSDKRVPVENEKKIILEFVRGSNLRNDNGHFNVIDPKFIHSYCPRKNRRYRYFCYHCSRPLSKYHNCNETKCYACHDSPACDETIRQNCDNCGLTLLSDRCFSNHLKYRCRLFKKCMKCGKSIHEQYFSQHLRANCLPVCRKCNQPIKEHPHYCNLSSPNLKKLLREDALPRIFVTYDIECSINDIQDSVHKPFVLCASVACDDCYDRDCLNRKLISCKECEQSETSDGIYRFKGPEHLSSFFNFIKELQIKLSNKRIDVYAHNAGGYDAQYLLAAIYSDKDTNMDDVSLVVSGRRITKISIRSGINFYDSLTIFQQSLAMLPKSFGFEKIVKKGYAPLALLKESRADEREFHRPGHFPDETCFFTKFMNEKQYADFKKWHETESHSYMKSNKVYDFYKELTEYCENDCRVLLAAIMIFRNMFKNVTGIDPLTRNFTLASIALEHFLVTKPEELNLGITPTRSYRTEVVDEKRIGDYVKQKSPAEVSLVNLLTHENKSRSFCQIAFGRNNGICEWKVNKKIGNYWPDAYCQTHNVIIEFNGCWWHPHDNCNYTFKENDNRMIQKQDVIKKIEYYKSNGIDCYTFHECSYQEDELIVNNFLNGVNAKTFFNERIRRIKYARENGPLDIRDAMTGGRTMNFRHQVDCRNSSERIWHSDIVSMYPYILDTEEFPLEHPILIEAPQNFDENWFGFIKCRVRAPLQLGIGVLPVKYKKRLLFPLCSKCVEERIDSPLFKRCEHTQEERTLTGTWTTEEMKLALSMGYDIEDIFFVLHYKKKARGVFKNYIKKWLAVKIAASGYPPEVDKNDDDQCQKYIQDVETKNGIKIDRSIIDSGHNPGLRSIAKLMLNSLWGKLAQRPNLPVHKIFNSYDEYIKLRSDDKYNILQEWDISHDKVLVSYELSDVDEARTGRTSLAVACFVTSHARCMLYKTMKKIGLNEVEHKLDSGKIKTEFVYNGKLLYVDTDSAFYVSERNLIPHSTHFGEWCDEVYNATGDPDAKIVLAVFVAPKCYMKELEMRSATDQTEIIRKVDIKAKGISLSRATNIVNGEIFHEKVNQYLKHNAVDILPLEVPQLNFKIMTEETNQDNKRYLKTYESLKRINITHGKRMFLLDNPEKFGWSEPIGHCGYDFKRAYDTAFPTK